jgi:hypothetical protein
MEAEAGEAEEDFFFIFDAPSVGVTFGRALSVAALGPFDAPRVPLATPVFPLLAGDTSWPLTMARILNSEGARRDGYPR